MHQSGISIEWDEATEYVAINFESDADFPILSTREYWPKKRCFVRYNTRCEIVCMPNARIIRLFYEHDNNLHIRQSDACWGVSEIRIPDGASEGDAVWEDYDDPTQWNGTARWKRIGSGLYKEQKRYQTTKQERKQELFRKLLLSFDERCCLTGETTTGALEAAHIIPSSQLGAEVAENGIILRADVHKLLDRGFFRFDARGNVVDIGDVSDDYRLILEGAALPESTAERVQAALRVVAVE